MMSLGGYEETPLADLWDWRRQVSDLYTAIRRQPEPRAAWLQWRETRDRLFKTHAQSPIEPRRRRQFAGLGYFPYDPTLRFLVRLAPIRDAEIREVAVGADGLVRMRPFAGTAGLGETFGRELTLYWLMGYGGGVFLPFADGTSGRETYGAGRYLLDTIKGADLGTEADGRIILDFNFAYCPSCAYSAQYVCPLAPEGNHLRTAIRAGELSPPQSLLFEE
jgi:uncharacterized protein (DUF1684 family)